MILINKDCIEALKELEDNSVDSIVTDPPYELGFMGKKWDNSGIAYNVEMWSECLRVLKPGGHILAFSGTRTYHRMAVAIEEAGFEVRDMIEWVYGSGFPKSLNIGKAVDKLRGNTIVTTYKPNYKNDTYGTGLGGGVTDYTPSNNEWNGWGTALKPAHEPICMARKPLQKKTVAENVLKYGTGGINIDESRVEGQWNGSTRTNSPDTKQIYGDYSKITTEQHPQGRFPANLIHDNSEEVTECFPNDSDRFFKSIIYNPKASKADRGVGNVHPTVKPTALMEYLIRMVTPKGGVVLDPFMGSGSTGVAAIQNGFEFIGIDMTPEYVEIAQARIKSTQQVKQLELL